MWSKSQLVTTKFFKMSFDIRPELQEKFNLEKEKTHDFWQLCLSPKAPKEKLDTSCNDSIKKLEKEKSLTNDFNDFISGITPFSRKNYFSSMKNRTFCKTCNIEIYKALLLNVLVQKNIKNIKYILL